MLKKHMPKSSNSKNILKHYLSDIVYGANDGIITTFTVISGVYGAKLSSVVIIILGFVNLFADGISMGASRFLSIRAGAIAHNEDRGILEPLYHSFATFISFFVFGLLPLFVFMLPEIITRPYIISSIITAFTLFFIGSLRGIIVKKGRFQGGFEMLAIGGIVAIIAYSVGYLINNLVQ